MKILIDTREQAPLDFPHPYIAETVSYKLDVGDYGCEFKNGYIPPIYFERKSLGDLFGTMGGGYKRFKKKFVYAKENKIKLILAIEGTYTKVSKGFKYRDKEGNDCESQITGSAMLKKLNTLWLKYDLTPIFCKNRTEMSTRIYDCYEAIGRMAQNDIQWGG